jgi:hypothetical protein
LGEELEADGNGLFGGDVVGDDVGLEGSGGHGGPGIDGNIVEVDSRFSIGGDVDGEVQLLESVSMDGDEEKTGKTYQSGD